MKKQWLIRTALIASVVISASAFVYALAPAKSADNSVAISQTITKGDKSDMVSPKCDDAKAEKKCDSGDKKCDSGAKSDSTKKCDSGDKETKKDAKCGEGKCGDSKKEGDKK